VTKKTRFIIPFVFIHVTDSLQMREDELDIDGSNVI